MSQHKEVLDNAIYRAIVHFESETRFKILGVKVNRLNTGTDETTCTSVSTEVKDRWL